MTTNTSSNAYTYTWDITSLKKSTDPSANLTGVIVQTYWTCTGTDANGVSGEFHGATPFSLNTVDANTFIPYENLTKDIIISWISNVVNSSESYKAHIDGKIAEKIATKVNPIIDVAANSFPWLETSNTSTANT